jgi:N6-adenosine-specific RNA methylase IME4
MDTESICSIPVNTWTEDKAHLWLWVINQHVDWGYEVARAWGFEPWNIITWAKPGLGTGRFQCNTESVLLCRKGSRHGNPFGMTGGTWFNWPRHKHSRKPVEFYEKVKEVSPGPYLELFATQQYDDWTCWGHNLGQHLCSDGVITMEAAGSLELLPS